MIECPNLITTEGNAVAFVKSDTGVKALVRSSVMPLRAVTPIEIVCHDCAEVQLRKVLTQKFIFEKYLCQSCSKKVERNGFYGRQHSSEFKARLSTSRKGVWGVGEANPMYGVNVWEYVDPAQREAMREKNREASKNWQENPFRDMKSYLGEERWGELVKKRAVTVRSRTPEQREKVSRSISEAAKKAQQRDPEGYRQNKQKAARASARSQASYKLNRPEKKVSEWLAAHHIKHSYSVIMGDGEHNYQFDFIVTDRRILIECHGRYWHADPRFYPDHQHHTPTQKANLERDQRKAEFAASRGFTLLIVWEDDVNNGDFSALQELLCD